MLDVHEVQQFVLDHLTTRPGGGQLTPDSSLLDSGVLDSLSLLQLVAALESRYGITVTDEDLDPDNFETVGSVARLTAARKAA
ncbi:acyl carrier protein [Longispora urticae]